MFQFEAIARALSMITVLLIVQILLRSASLESLLTGKRHTALPAAICSGVIFLICLALGASVERMDLEVRGSRNGR